MALQDKSMVPGIGSAAFRIPFLFFGNETLATGVSSQATILNSLVTAGWRPTGLVLAQRKPTKQPLAVELVAQQHGIDISYVSDKSELQSIVEDYRPSFAVLAAFGMIIDRQVLQLIPDGIANIHPSLLPRYRGTSPIESAILNGDKQTGVSLMRLDEGMDTGPLYEQRALDDDPNQLSKQQLHDRLARLGAELLLDHIDAIANGSAQTFDQSSEGTVVTQRITKQDGLIDFNQSAEVIERQIRAYQGWPTAWFVHQNRTIQILSSTPQQTNQLAPGELRQVQGELLIGTADYDLKLKRVKPAGKQAMTGDSFSRGYLKSD